MLQKSSILKTLEAFFIQPTREHYLLDISRKIRISHTSVKRNLVTLAKTGLIKKRIEKKGGRKFPVYKANIENKLFRRHKIAYNVTSIFESAIIEFLEEKLTPKTVVLFGSYARGEDTETSDIDLYVECKKEEFDIGKFEKKLGRKIELHFNENFATYPNELKNNIINGLTLAGFLEGYR